MSAFASWRAYIPVTTIQEIEIEMQWHRTRLPIEDYHHSLI